MTSQSLPITNGSPDWTVELTRSLITAASALGNAFSMLRNTIEGRARFESHVDMNLSASAPAVMA